jgi:hypothetical protein
METSKTLTGEQLSLWTSSAADTPANHSAQQANDEEPTTLDTCGHGLETPLAHYDLATQSWKTSGDISLWGDLPSLENLPKSGMTRNGVLYQQPDWVRPIDATGSLSWPTPRSCSAMAATITPESVWNEKRLPNLETVVGRRMWPTPTAVTRPMEGNVRMYRAKIQAGEMTEAEAEAILGKSVWAAQGKVPAMWPTPQANDAKNPYARVREHSQATMLGEAVVKADPTTGGGKLNPMWVEWLMGFPLGWTDLKD